MTSDIDSVGYRRPPKSGQFAKGRSGNPRGRPRKQSEKPPEFSPARHPTRTILRKVQERKINVTDANGRHEVTAREAILRALTVKAMTGGPGSVLAARTLIQYGLAEDERYHQERQDSFDYWLKDQSKSRAAIAAALAAGRPPPETLPHPDDIVFDWNNIVVSFLGAFDEKGLVRERKLQAYQDLAYEMLVYADDGSRLPSEEDPYGRAGIFLTTYWWARSLLPPRLWRSAASYEAHIWQMRSLGEKAYRDHLEQRCSVVGLPFIRRGNGRLRSMSLKGYDLEFKPLPPRAKRRRKKTELADVTPQAQGSGTWVSATSIGPGAWPDESGSGLVPTSRSTPPASSDCTAASADHALFGRVMGRNGSL